MPTKKTKTPKKLRGDPEKKPATKQAVSSKKITVSDDSAESELEEQVLKPARYYEGIGRRKRAVARVRLFTRGDKEFTVNNKLYTQYFPTKDLQSAADGALRKMKVVDKFKVSVYISGGGIRGQAEAVRHGTSRALVKFNPDFRKRLRRSGYLGRDPREKERRKFGLKKARRAPQWSKR